MRTSRTLPDARFFEFPVGHGAYRSHECPREIASAFVDDPTALLDDSCIGRMEPIEFVTRWRASPDAMSIALGLGSEPRRMAPLGLGIGVLGLGLLALPLGALARRVRGMEGTAAAPAHAWVLGTALLALGFWLALLGAVAWTAITHPLLILVGLPFWTQPLFWLPNLGLAVAAAAAVLLWRDRALGARPERWLDTGILLVAAFLLVLRFTWTL